MSQLPPLPAAARIAELIPFERALRARVSRSPRDAQELLGRLGGSERPKLLLSAEGGMLF